MKPKREGQRYQETLGAMHEALGFPPGLYHLAAKTDPRHSPGWLQLQLGWGRPKCHVMFNSHGPVLNITVKPDWLVRVHGQGLTMVDGVLVLHAEEAPPIEGAEAAWLCIVCIHKADWSEAKPQLTYLVKYGGMLRAGIDQQEAKARAIRDYAFALGVDMPEDVERLLRERGAVIPAEVVRGPDAPQWIKKSKLGRYINGP